MVKRSAGGRVLLTGATGFVGGRLHPVLRGQGLAVRCLTRDAERARTSLPGHDWAEGDVGNAEALRRAMDGCRSAYYLVHDMGSSEDFARREETAARTFAACAAAAGLERVVYLGGVRPEGEPLSEHLASRARVGEVLRAGRVPAIELRASMIVGHGSLSFLIVRDLAARLPFMVLPRWLDSRTEPVAIDDVLLALDRAREMPLAGSAAHDIPGPEVLSGREILMRTARALDLREPLAIRVPVLTPRLSALWVRLVTRADWPVAREIVVGLKSDLLARDRDFWRLVGAPALVRFDEAVRCAIAEEREGGAPGGPWGGVERVRALVAGRE